MANPLCVDTRHGAEQSTFGLDLCLRDHKGRSGEQVIGISMNDRCHNSSSSVCRISNWAGVKIFDRPVVMFVLMFPNVANMYP